jgi:hypothetical protein
MVPTIYPYDQLANQKNTAATENAADSTAKPLGRTSEPSYRIRRPARQ